MKDEKQKLVEYRKKYYENEKKRLIIIIRDCYSKSNDLESSFDKEYIKAKYHDFWGGNFEVIN